MKTKKAGNIVALPNQRRTPMPAFKCLRENGLSSQKHQCGSDQRC